MKKKFLNLSLALVSLLPTSAAYALSASDLPNANLLGDQQGEVASYDPKFLIAKVIIYILTFAGALAVLLIIYGGVTYITAGGSDDRVKTAKKILTSAITGLVIILLAIVIVNFVMVTTRTIVGAS